MRLLMWSSFMWEGRTLTAHWNETQRKKQRQQKRGNGKVCPVTARRGLHSELHTWSGLSVVIGMTWRAWACWRAAATDAPRLVSSQYRLERLRADTTLSVPLVLNFGHKKLVLFCNFQCPNRTRPRRTLASCTSFYLAQKMWPFKLWSGVSLTRPS